MKYRTGNIVLLNDGRSVYVYQIDKEGKKYQVFDIEDENDLFAVTEREIYDLLVSS